MKKKLAVVLALCLSTVGMTACGATGTSGNKTIKFNAMKSTMDLKNVKFYDFCNGTLLTSYTKSVNVLSNSLNSAEATFAEKDGTTRTIAADATFSSKPAKLGIYINSSKTEVDEYNFKY